MDIGRWIKDNQLLFGLGVTVVLLVIIVIVLSVYVGYAAKPIIIPGPPPAAPLPPIASFGELINSPNWKWIWPVITAIPILVITYFNWRIMFRKEFNSPISSDICSIIPGTNNDVTRIPSYYFANISFFISYLFMNALSNFNMKSEADVDKSLVDNRQYRSAATMFILIFVFIALILLRYNTSNCDSIIGILLTISVFTAFGLLWYKVAEYCGAKGSDLMGISQNIVSSKAKAPVVCKRKSS
uniref:Uncharacterized protein n=1 Tax=viral metagenome TaxID=1070528 RepID=A0A6C0IEX0_9ZZZZ